MKSTRVAYLAWLAALACSGDAAPDDTDWRQRWLETAPQQYVAKVCSTGFVMRTCSVSAVDAGQAVAARSRLGDSDWEEREPPVDAMEGLLSAAERDTEESCERRVTRHETYDFPARVYTDCGEEGWGVALACFAEGTLELTRCQ